jgi:hypothetical protein
LYDGLQRLSYSGGIPVLRSQRCRSESFFEISLLPYQAPRFDVINDSHYRPAFDEALRQKRRTLMPSSPKPPA